ncbi:MAG: glycosyltransferase family 2 protein [Acidimicrobiales bacterium]
MILVLWNCEQELPQCLGPLAAEDADLSIDMICVDNASEDGSVTIAREHGALVVEMGTNVGFPVAVNAGLGHVTGDYVLLLNPDVVLVPGVVSRCLQELQGDPGIGMVGCNLRLADGSADLGAARRFRSLPGIAFETLGLTRLTMRLDVQYVPDRARRESRDVDCINGAFMLLSTDLLRWLGGLDETAFMYLEDQDLCRRVWDHGLRVRFVAEAIATHVGGASTRRASAERQTIAYLHRTDADVEMIARRHGACARLVALALFGLRALFGLLVGVVRKDHVLRSRYAATLSWLSRQVPARTPPPPIR